MSLEHRQSKFGNWIDAIDKKYFKDNENQRRRNAIGRRPRVVRHEGKSFSQIIGLSRLAPARCGNDSCHGNTGAVTRTRATLRMGPLT